MLHIETEAEKNLNMVVVQEANYSNFILSLYINDVNKTIIEKLKGFVVGKIYQHSLFQIEGISGKHPLPSYNHS